MKLNPIPLIVGILACASVSIPVLAANHSANMTCEDFIGLDAATQPKVVYWAQGFNYGGKTEDAIIDFDQNDSMVPALVRECLKNPKQLFISQVKAECKKRKNS